MQKCSQKVNQGRRFQTLEQELSSPAVPPGRPPRQPQDSEGRPDDWKKHLQFSGNALTPRVVGVPCARAVAEDGDPRTREGARVWGAVLPGARASTSHAGTSCQEGEGSAGS